MPESFYFKLRIEGLTETDSIFKEVSGLSIGIESNNDTIGDNLLNQYQHHTPSTPKIENVVLKRGIIPKDSTLATWCANTINYPDKPEIKQIPLTISLHNKNGLPVKSWILNNAWPIKWSVSDHNTTQNDLIIESVEFAYSSLKMD